MHTFMHIHIYIHIQTYIYIYIYMYYIHTNTPAQVCTLPWLFLGAWWGWPGSRRLFRI